MSSIQSLGLHEPSALSYLVAESILPADPHPSLYKWTVSQVPDENGFGRVEEEILTTQHFVVWSRNGAIKRASSLAVEGEPILHAFVTRFGPDEELESRRQWHNDEEVSLEWALVVVLKTQAHIFLLSGESYVLPLSFEVGAAFPFPLGFILQRRLGDGELDSRVEPQHDLSTINETLTSIGGNSSRPSLILPERLHSNPGRVQSNANGVPRTFSFTEIMSELGLVVCSPHRKGEPLDDCISLPRSEKLVFISGIAELGSDDLNANPVCMALSLNETTSTFSLWHVGRGPVTEHHRQKARNDGHHKSRTSLRKSSNVYGRDTGNLRESVLGSRHGYPDSGPYSSLEETTSFPANDLASQLGPEFGDVRVQTRSARRVSSMLARTDLGSAMDRNTFNDLAMGHVGRKSLNRAAKRGESIGSFNDRQSFGFRRRSSYPTNASIFSTGTSFLDLSARGLLEEMDPLRQSTRLEEDALEASESNLPRTIGFFKVKSFPSDQNSTITSSHREVKVFQLDGPSSPDQNGHRMREIYLCVMDKTAQEMTLVRVLVKIHMPASTPKQSMSKSSFELKVAEVRRMPGIRDACTVIDGSIQRLVLLTQSRSQIASLHLEAPWSPSFHIQLPEWYAVYDPFLGPQRASPRKDKDTGIRRSIPGTEVKIEGLLNSGFEAQIYAIDQEGRQHSLGLPLAPRDGLVRQILRTCGLILGPSQEETLQVAFWEVSRWLRGRDPSLMSEWTAMVVVLFSLAVPFINNQNPKSTPSRRKKTGLLRSSSGSAIDLANYHLMHKEGHELAPELGTRGSAWNWLSQKPVSNTTLSPKSQHTRTTNVASLHDGNPEKNSFLMVCIAMAREYTQTPLGEAALGPEGYLPTSINRDREQRYNAIPGILLGLHLLYEEGKLSDTSAPNLKGSKDSLLLVLVQLGRWLGWRDWTAESNTYYEHESGEVMESLYDDSFIDGLRIPAQPFPPPSIYQHLDGWINGSPSAPFLTLARIAGVTAPSSPDDPLWRMMFALTPRTLAMLSFIDHASGQLGPTKALDILPRSGVSEHMLTTLPDGVAAAFCQAIALKRFGMSRLAGLGNQPVLGTDHQNRNIYGSSHPSHKQQLMPSHEAVRDYHTVCSSALEAETLQRWDASSEADRQAITKLIFSEDRRFQEASKIVNQTRPPLVECTPEPGWSEVDLLEAQKALAQHVARRTLSVAAGRGMMQFTARVPLLTERVPIPAFSLQCVMKPRNASESTQAMTFSADKSTFTEEKVCWAFFHNGASMGLMISSDAQGIDTSWILYNKPPELTNRHAGFLLALGLNGHLRSLAKWVAFKYLTPKHTMTSVGLLLGLSASFLGTMDTLITRLLSVHVTRLLPPGAAELNLSPLTQTTGIMGIGLLYHDSQHRRMSEVMLSEIENNDPEEGVVPDNVLRDEGYRLAAGFSLGLINLGQGRRLHGLHDVGVVERLLNIAVGTKNVNMVHVLDRATAGAVMALAFIFLKTNNEAIAKKVDVPDTLHQFDYVRPDIFLLRTLARHLIMWDSIQPTQDFIRMSLPKPYTSRSDLRSTKLLSTEDMPFFNIVAGICFAISLRFAGSQRHDVRDLLVTYLDQFLRLSRLPARNYDARVTLNSVRNCLDALALATASVMAGSGDLHVMRRLRALHGRVDKETPFGSHLAAHMALGALFLAGGTRTFGTSNLCIAALCIAFYPVFPSDVLDNRGHLQALRHLWVLAVEGRCLVARDGDAGGSVVGGMTGLVQLRDGTTQVIRLPGLVPEFDTIKSIEIKGAGFWDSYIDLESGGKHLLEKIRQENAVNVVLRRRVAYDTPSKDLFMAEIQARAESMGIPSVDPNAVPSYSQITTNPEPLEWLFGLEAFRDFDHAERALILAPTPVDGKAFLRTSVVDSRLEFEKGVLPPAVERGRADKDKLWQLRLLFAWFDRWEKEDEENERRQKEQGPKEDVQEAAGDNEEKDGDRWFSGAGGTWLRREVIERLRWRVWNMTTGGTVEGGNDDADDEDEDM